MMLIRKTEIVISGIENMLDVLKTKIELWKKEILLKNNVSFFKIFEFFTKKEI